MKTMKAKMSSNKHNNMRTLRPIPEVLHALSKGIVLLLISMSLMGQSVPINNDIDEVDQKFTAKVDFRIKETEVVESIREKSLFGAGDSKKLTAKQGYKLVVVTLEGVLERTEKESIVTFQTDDFIAKYINETTAINQPYPFFESHRSLAIWRNGWNIPQKGSSRTIQVFGDVDTIDIKAAFILPEDVASFEVCYPIAADGLALIENNE